jgi:hypothetical protein
MTDKYILDDDGNPVPEPDLMRWGRWLRTADRSIASSQFGDVWVSTVFLGLNHRFSEGSPLLYETMIFGGEHDGYQDRCGTPGEAREMHDRACAMVAPIN